MDSLNVREAERIAAGSAEPEPPPPPGPPERRTPGRPMPIAVEFLPDAVELEQAATPRAAHALVYVLVGLIAAVLGWSALSRLDMVVMARGMILTTAPTITVQPLETAIIRSLRVAPGDQVASGQTLAELDSTFSAADMAQVTARLRALDARLARLSAEFADRPYEPDPAAMNDEERTQHGIHLRERSGYQAKIRSFDQNMESQLASIRTLEADSAMLRNQIQALREVEDIRSTLQRSQYGSRITLLDARHLRLEGERSLMLSTNRIAETRHRIAAIEAEREAYIQEYRRRLAEHLAEASEERTRLQEELNKAGRRREMVNVTAPTDAVVLEVGQYSNGSVIREAETLMVLVPADVPYEAELMVSTADVGLIRIGSPVRLKLDAFPFQKHGTVAGTVRSISEGVFGTGRDQAAGFAYKVRVRLDAMALRGVPDDVRLIPGMSLTGEVRVGERRVISYFFYPIIKTFDESIREP